MKNKYISTAKQFYLICIIASVIFWLFLLSSVYTSSSVLQIKEIEQNNFDFGNHLSENYTPSITGSYLFSEWLRSERAYTLLANQLDIQKIYKKGDIFTKFGGIYDLLMHGDRSAWSHFNKNLVIGVNSNSNTVSLSLSSYNNKDSQKILYKLISIGQDFFKSSHKEEDRKLRNYIDFLSSSLDNDLKVINKKINGYISNGISIYPKENYLNGLLIRNIVESKIMDLDVLLNSTKTITSTVYQVKVAQKKFLKETLDRLYFQDIFQIQSNEKMETALNKKRFLENLKQSIEQKKYILQRANYIDRYQITIISPPSLFIERSGPYRVKGLFISLLIISLIYWLIKD